MNAGGAFLFFAVGLGVLAVAGGTRRGRVVGGFAATFGLTYIVENLLLFDGDVGADLLLLVTAAPSAFFAALLAHELLDGVGAGRRHTVGAMAAILVALGASYTLGLRGERVRGVVEALGFPVDGLGYIASAALLAQQVALVLLLGALGARAKAFRADPAETRRVAYLALALGPFIVFMHTQVFFTAGVPLDSPGGVALLVGNLGLGVVAAVATIPFASKPDAPDRLARAVFPALLLAGAAGLALAAAPDGEDFGLFGVIRTVGIVFLVLAVVRHDLLGVPLPHFAVKRGAVATGALAILLIVAQVGQNFFSAKYGLLTGGVVAGAFLFAAHPLQRWVERATGLAPPGRETVTSTTRAAENERVYAMTLRRYLADGRLAADEEVALAHLADELGLTTRRATELRHVVEREKGVR